jgi:hypothetical protein
MRSSQRDLHWEDSEHTHVSDSKGCDVADLEICIGADSKILGPGAHLDYASCVPGGNPRHLDGSSDVVVDRAPQLDIDGCDVR